MAEQDRPDDPPREPGGPSLELPSLRLGRRRRRVPSDVPVPAPAPEPAQPCGSQARPSAPVTARPTLPQLPALSPRLATPFVGLVVGAVVVGLVRASQGVCEVVRGTSSCGNAGFLLLVATLLLAGWLGAALLRGFGVTDAGSTSALGIGLVAVVLMLFLGGQLFSWWMVLVVPVVAMLAYLSSHHVTTSVVEPTGSESHR